MGTGQWVRVLGTVLVLLIAALVAFSIDFKNLTFEQQVIMLFALGLFVLFCMCAVRMFLPSSAKSSESG